MQRETKKIIWQWIGLLLFNIPFILNLFALQDNVLKIIFGAECIVIGIGVTIVKGI